MCIQIDQESTLRKHYDLIMTALYIITTISTMENIIQSFGNILIINSKILHLVASHLLMQANQRQILHFISVRVNITSVKREEIISQMSKELTLYKFMIIMISQLYMYIRLFSIYDIDLNAQEPNKIYDYMQFMAIESVSLKNLIVLFTIILFQQYFSFCQIQYYEVAKCEQLISRFESQQYEKVWQKTVDSNIQNGVVFYNL